MVVSKTNSPETALQSLLPDDRVRGISLPCLSTHQHCLGSPLLLVHCIGKKLPSLSQLVLEGLPDRVGADNTS